MKSPSTLPRLVIEVRQPAPPAKHFDVVDLAPSLVAGLLVVLGWRVIEHYARQREKRSDLREAVSAFREAVDEVTTVASAFYRLPGNAPQAMSLAGTIRAKIGALPDYLDAMRRAGLKLETNDVLRLFRQAVTGGEFDSQTRQPQPSVSPAIDRMIMAGQDLSRAVQTALFQSLLGSAGRKNAERQTPN